MSDANNRRILTAGMAVFAVSMAVWAGVKIKQRFDAPEASEPAATRGPDAKATKLEPEVPFEALYDWNDWTSPLASALTPFVAERLGAVRQDKLFQPQLARQVEELPDVAVVVLRRDVYWSDRAQLSGAQVVAAFERAKRRPANVKPTLQADASPAPPPAPALASDAASTAVPAVPPPKAAPSGDDIRPHWFDSVELTVATAGDLKALDPAVQKRLDGAAPSSIVLVRGYSDAADLHALLSHRILAPIRPDLLGDERDPAQAGDHAAWLVTLGRYAPRAVPKAPLTAKTEIQLEPNPSYYRGPATTPVTLTVEDLQEIPR